MISTLGVQEPVDQRERLYPLGHAPRRKQPIECRRGRRGHHIHPVVATEHEEAKRKGRVAKRIARSQALLDALDRGLPHEAGAVRQRQTEEEVLVGG